MTLSACGVAWQGVAAIDADLFNASSGEVYSYTVVRRAMNPAFQEDAPCVFAILQREEELGLTADIVNCPPEGVRVDMPVKAAYDVITPEIAL